MRSVLRQTTRQLARKRLQTPFAKPLPAPTVQAARNPRRDAAPSRPSAPPSRTSKRAASSSIPSSIDNVEQHEGLIGSSGIPPTEGPPEENPEDEIPVEIVFAEDLELQRALGLGQEGQEAASATETEVQTHGSPEFPEKPADGERTKRARKPRADIESAPPPPLPEELNILWTPETLDAPSSSALPPPEIMEKVLTDLHVSLHPQTQHRAAYSSPSSGSPTEPSLALYCPFEGGEYVIDETVKELARQTDSEVIVIDAVQIAAGESGCFGKSASVFQFPDNPLHFRAPVPRAPPSPPNPLFPGQEPDDPEAEGSFFPTSMTVQFMPPMSGSRQGRLGSSRPSSGSPAFKVKAFFDALIRSPASASTPAPNAEGEAAPRPKKRSRLIYIRDYPALAPSAASWYPSLLAAVRQRRQGPIARPTSPVSESITIIFGVTPAIVAPSNPPPFNPQALLGLMNAKQGPPIVLLSPKSGRHDYGEDEHADKARERRLKERLRRWERNENALLDEIPRLPESDHGSPTKEGGPLVLLGGAMSGEAGGPPPSLLQALQGQSRMGGGGDFEESSQFFRSSVLVPSVRNPGMEKSSRISRRRELNELTMRMGVASVGGVMHSSLAKLVQDLQIQESTDDLAESISGAAESVLEEKDSKVLDMWDEWGKNVQLWKSVKNIADRAVGSIMAKSVASDAKPTLDATPVPWQAIVSAWTNKSSIRELRRSWVKETGAKLSRDVPEGEQVEEPYQAPQDDDLVHRIKEDPELPQHEQRLLGCIIDAASMPTSFDDVHLPSHTIDSVRTIVSLPLLHPSAFQQGILKQHSMSGCLLFGPPGTGKTLVVRALAKEAGCRMLAVQPSDVMDMYVGEGEKLVRSVFSLARRLSPCVIFLDEIDALFGARSSARESGSSLAHNGILTEFMQEMDGLKTRRDSNVIVIGATNRPFDLDDAILRRLPRRMLVDLPGIKEREEILKILLRDELLAPDVDLGWLAKQTELFSGSDLKHLCVSAALDAVKEGIDLPWVVPKTESAQMVEEVGKADESVPLESPEISTSHETVEAVITEEASETLVEAQIIEPSIQAQASESTSDVPKEEEQQEPVGKDEAQAGVDVETRVLHLRHFTKALKEISASSSESLGSLSALRKWNEEFGEGQKKKKRTIWGKGSFGFSEPKSDMGVPADGHVSVP